MTETSREAELRPLPDTAGVTWQIEHDGFKGREIGSYTTLEGKQGVVLQQIGTQVVHVYNRKWLKPCPAGVTGEPVASPQQVQEACAQVADRFVARDVDWGERHVDDAAASAHRAERGRAIAGAIRALIPPTPLDRQAVERETVGALTKLAAECHRAKWQFDFSDENRLHVGKARDMVKRAFGELHRIGDLALKLRSAALSPLPGTEGDSPTPEG